MSARDDLYLFAMVGKVQDDDNRAMAVKKLDAHRAEVLREAAPELDAICQQYGVLGVGDRLLRLADAAGQGEKDTAPAATSTPQLDERAARLYDHILGTGGDWSTRRAHDWVVANVDPNATRHRVRHALQHLAARGYLIEHNRPGRCSYTPNYAKDER